MIDKVDLVAAARQVAELWDCDTPLRFNDYDVHVNRIHGEYVWHRHEDTDDVLMVLAGRLIVELRDGQVELGPGEMTVVPRGVEHRPVAPEETLLLCIEPRGTQATGDAPAEGG